MNKLLEAFQRGFIKSAVQSGSSEEQADMTLQEYFNSPEYKAGLKEVADHPVLTNARSQLKQKLDKYQ